MTKEELEIDNKRLDFNEKVQLVMKQKELKEQDIRLNKLCFDYQEKDKRIEELEQENTRLKLELEALDGQIPWKDIKDKSEVLGKLTEAKEIIRQLLLLPYANNEEVNADVTSILNKAENFLSEVEK